MNLKTAIDIVARVSLSDAADSWFDSGWENLPDICESDYERVVAQMRLMLPTEWIDIGGYDEAITFLEARANKETT